ncbi:MAG TPA: hypothetical protein VFW89_05265 [Gemmatimonadaceae bacterium]|nr:hypothetical protein [Gemmatimonadaceae bacterium]HWG53559.1 hypothetical protein [Gemmatimonadaceae bacterium]
MDPDAPFVIAVVTITFGSILILARMWFSYRARKFTAPPEMHAIEERLNRIEQAVDAIAVETERISEGQRFTTKLLADRHGSDAHAEALRPGQQRS